MADRTTPPGWVQTLRWWARPGFVAMGAGLIVLGETWMGLLAFVCAFLAHHEMRTGYWGAADDGGTGTYGRRPLVTRRQAASADAASGGRSSASSPARRKCAAAALQSISPPLSIAAISAWCVRIQAAKSRRRSSPAISARTRSWRRSGIPGTTPQECARISGFWAPSGQNQRSEAEYPPKSRR